MTRFDKELWGNVFLPCFFSGSGCWTGRGEVECSRFEFVRATASLGVTILLPLYMYLYSALPLDALVWFEPLTLMVRLWSFSTGAFDGSSCGGGEDWNHSLTVKSGGMPLGYRLFSKGVVLRLT